MNKLNSNNFLHGQTIAEDSAMKYIDKVYPAIHRLNLKQRIIIAITDIQQ